MKTKITASAKKSNPVSRKLWPVPVALILLLLAVLVVWNPLSIKIIGADSGDNGADNQAVAQNTAEAVAPVLEERWQSMALPNIGNLWRLNAVAFAGPNEGWAVGSDESSTKGVVLHYLNGRWEEDYMPYAGSSWTVHLVDIALTGPREAWVVGDKYYIWADPDRFKPFALKMTNGKWRSIGLPRVGAISYDLAAVAVEPASGDVYAVGGAISKKQRTGLIMKYSGRWSNVSNPPVGCDQWDLHDICFPAPNTGWAVGKTIHPADNENALLVLSYRNGQWIQEKTPVAKGVTHSLLAVSFPAPGIGWAGGERALLKYTNGRWEKEAVPGNIENMIIKSIHFTSPENGWAVGWDEAAKTPLWLQHTSSGWRRINTRWDSKLEQLNDIFFLKSGVGYAVGGMAYRGDYPGAVLMYK